MTSMSFASALAGTAIPKFPLRNCAVLARDQSLMRPALMPGRAALLEAGGLKAGRFERVMLYPFDERWCFHTNVQPIWNRSRRATPAPPATGSPLLLTLTHGPPPGYGLSCFF